MVHASCSSPRGAFRHLGTFDLPIFCPVISTQDSARLRIEHRNTKAVHTRHQTSLVLFLSFALRQWPPLCPDTALHFQMIWTGRAPCRRQVARFRCSARRRRPSTQRTKPTLTTHRSSTRSPFRRMQLRLRLRAARRPRHAQPQSKHVPVAPLPCPPPTPLAPVRRSAAARPPLMSSTATCSPSPNHRRKVLRQQTEKQRQLQRCRRDRRRRRCRQARFRGRQRRNRSATSTLARRRGERCHRRRCRRRRWASPTQCVGTRRRSNRNSSRNTANKQRESLRDATPAREGGPLARGETAASHRPRSAACGAPDCRPL